MRTSTTLSAIILSFCLSSYLMAQTSTPAPQPAAPGQQTLDLPFDKPVSPPPPDKPPEPKPPKIPENQPPKFFDKPIKGEGDVIVFVIDNSGSMDWDAKSYTDLNGRPATGSRMERAKAELTRSVNALADNFKFNIVAYDCCIKQMWSDVKEANTANKSEARRWISRVRPDGGTGTGPGTAKGLAAGKNIKIVVLLTDGAPNCLSCSGWDSGDENKHKRMIRDANKQRATINVFGVGVDSGHFRAFLRAVAQENSGTYTEVP